MISRQSFFITVVFLLRTLSVCQSANLGDQCISNQTEPGTCKILYECHSAFTNLKAGQNTEKCQNEFTNLLICCPNSTPSTQITTTTTAPETLIPDIDENGKQCNYDLLTNGTCKELHNCPRVQIDILIGKKAKICDDLYREQIVCCPIVKNRVTRPLVTNSNSIRLSEHKCKEYSEYVYEYTKSFDGTTTKRDRCGFLVQRLNNAGNVAFPMEFPHMANIGFGNSSDIQWLCSGSVISRRYILMAAHCASSRSWGPVTYVRVGDLVIGEDNDDAHPQTIEVAEIFIHPSFSRRTYYNDIALVKTSDDIEFNIHVRPACLNSDYVLTQQRGIISGWGETSEDTFNAVNDKKTLRKKYRNFLNSEECEREFSKTSVLKGGFKEEIQICDGPIDTNWDLCLGDSGAPLQVYHDLYCMYKIVGIVNYGYNCQGKPGISTKIYPFLDWIESIAFTHG